MWIISLHLRHELEPGKLYIIISWDSLSKKKKNAYKVQGTVQSYDGNKVKNVKNKRHFKKLEIIWKFCENNFSCF